MEPRANDARLPLWTVTSSRNCVRFASAFLTIAVTPRGSRGSHRGDGRSRGHSAQLTAAVEPRPRCGHAMDDGRPFVGVAPSTDVRGSLAELGPHDVHARTASSHGLGIERRPRAEHGPALGLSGQPHCAKAGGALRVAVGQFAGCASNGQMRAGRHWRRAEVEVQNPELGARRSSRASTRPAEQPKQAAAALGFRPLLCSLWRLLYPPPGRQEMSELSPRRRETTEPSRKPRPRQTAASLGLQGSVSALCLGCSD